ncbi:MAG: hypothetical protein HQL27_04515 [Candidatus Omnitrophica bacterium]|nr:hypothetical protein [Candidatus Omnitrophota bacterium]
MGDVNIKSNDQDRAYTQKQKEFYSRIRILGVAITIPLILGMGPLVGYFAGEFLIVKFSWPNDFIYVFIYLGFAMAVYEIFRIIKFMRKEIKQ